MLKKTKGCAFGLFAGTILKTVVLVFNAIIHVFAKILVFLGLWIPFVYALFGLTLKIFFGFDPFDFSLYSTLYLSGGLACIICSLLIGIRNLILRPSKSIFEGFKHPLWEKNRDENIEKDKEKSKLYLTKKERKKLSPPEIDDFSTQKSKKLQTDFLPPRPINNRQRPMNPVNYQQRQIPPMNYNPNANYQFCNSNMDHEVHNANMNHEVHNINANYEYHNPQLPNSNPAYFEIPQTMNSVERPRVYFSKLHPELLIHEYSNRFEIYKIIHNNSVLDRVEYK
ncbi:MAG: hypothetical protein WCR54_00200 [Clostridia bacterium]